MKKYVLAGAGGRGLNMYALPLATELKDYVKFVGIYDVNRLRAEHMSRECGGIPVYDDFDNMLKETSPDAVIVTTVDAFHHEYIIKALEAGCDAITEKPMTIDAEKCRQILEAEKRTGKKVIVTFNMRFSPFVTRVKELLKEGAVGKILSVDLEWILDTSHGADYFRRWHRYMDKSGGLLVHKSTHHFDMVNWWLEEEPEEVCAFGTRRFYGPTREERGERCLTCQYKNKCEFYWDIAKSEHTRKLYLEAEYEDGYYRDRCVFAEDIDIYDTMSVNVKYSNGAMMSYSLNAHSPYEGWRIAINGTEGRLETENIYSGHGSESPNNQVTIYNRKGEVITYDIPKSRGGHGGGDERLRRQIFVGDVADPLGRQAGSWAGVMSAIIGIAANESIKEKRLISIKDLLKESEI